MADACLILHGMLTRISKSMLRCGSSQVDQELKAFTASGTQVDEEAIQLLAVPVVLAAESATDEDTAFLRACLGYVKTR